MEVIHDFGEWANTTVTSSDESVQVMAAETLVETPTLPPLDATTAGLVFDHGGWRCKKAEAPSFRRTLGSPRVGSNAVQQGIVFRAAMAITSDVA